MTGSRVFTQWRVDSLASRVRFLRVEQTGETSDRNGFPVKVFCVSAVMTKRAQEAVMGTRDVVKKL